MKWIQYLKCRLGSHNWSCRDSRSCQGIGDHYCLNCYYGLAAWAGKNNQDVGEGNI